MLQFVKAVVGNSSSGIIEAPSFGVETVNIGERQGGRLRAKSVVDCNPEHDDIERALLQMFDPEYRASLANVENPYGTGGASKRLTTILESLPMRLEGAKPFLDLDFQFVDEGSSNS